MIIILDNEYYSLEDNGDGAGNGYGSGTGTLKLNIKY